jgi:hypothetical protein
MALFDAITDFAKSVESVELTITWFVYMEQAITTLVAPVIENVLAQVELVSPLSEDIVYTSSAHALQAPP